MRTFVAVLLSAFALVALTTIAHPIPKPPRLGEITAGVYDLGHRSPYRFATITVYHAGTAELAPIYVDILGTPKANPFSANTRGWWAFYTEDCVDVRISNSTLMTPEMRKDRVPMLGGLTLKDFWRRFGR